MHYTKPEVYEFISKQTNDPILERKTCAVSGTKFPIFQWDKDVLEKLSPVIWGQKYLFPLPKYCPEIRLLQKMCFRNERTLYKSTCAYSWSPMLSMYHPDMWYTVYSIAWYLSDSWQASSYWKEINYDEPFFSQYAELLKSTPKLAQSMSIKNLENNSQYVNYAADLKNCYLVFDTDTNEDCYYSTNINHSNNTVDSLMTLHSDHCYECLDSHNLYKCSFVQNSSQCTYSQYLYSCVNCDHCLCCSNLNGQSYQFLNQPISKEKYEEIAKEMTTTWGKMKYSSLFDELLEETTRSAIMISNTESGIWNAIYNSKEVFMSYQISNCEDLRYCHSMNDAKDSMDMYSFGSNAWNLYNSISVWRNSSNISLCVDNYKAHNNLYCIENRKNSFGFWCANFHHKNYSILNKVYTKEEYEKTVKQLAYHMQETWERGEFFPTNLSPFPYNDTIANDYFPVHSINRDWKIQVLNTEWYGVLTIDNEDVSVSDATLDLWWNEKVAIKWRNAENLVWLSETVNPIIPINLTHESWDLLKNDSWVANRVVKCSVSWRPFRFTKAEIIFYKNQWVPLPMKHPDIRHQERLHRRSWRTLYVRKCDKSGKEIISVYPQETNFAVYSVDGFQKEVCS